MIFLKKDGRKIAHGEDDGFIYKYIHSRHSYSVSYAMEYAGYTVDMDGVNITKDFILKDNK